MRPQLAFEAVRLHPMARASRHRILLALSGSPALPSHEPAQRPRLAGKSGTRRLDAGLRWDWISCHARPSTLSTRPQKQKVASTCRGQTTPHLFFPPLHVLTHLHFLARLGSAYRYILKNYWRETGLGSRV